MPVAVHSDVNKAGSVPTAAKDLDDSLRERTQLPRARIVMTSLSVPAQTLIFAVGIRGVTNPPAAVLGDSAARVEAELASGASVDAADEKGQPSPPGAQSPAMPDKLVAAGLVLDGALAHLSGLWLMSLLTGGGGQRSLWR